MTNLKRIDEVADAYGRDLDRINLKLRSLASSKTRLNKQKGKPDYEFKMSKLLADIEELQQAKHLLTGHSARKKVTQYEQQDVDILTYDETMRAIESIRSKKSNTRWLTDTEGDNDEFRNAERIEQMLLAHKATVQPISGNTVAKSDIKSLIELIEATPDIRIETILDNLKEMIK